jgi:hypothetical protein
MGLIPKEYSIENLGEKTTGNHDELVNYKIILYPFDKYQIKIKLTPANEFIEVMEVQINKDFLSHKQKITSKGLRDVDKFYRK